MSLPSTKDVPAEEVSTDHISRHNCNPQETIISVQDQGFCLSTGDLENLRSLDEACKAAQNETTAPPLIQRVPSLLSGQTEFLKYFKPRVIAIGPLHHDDPSLRGAEKLKLKLAAHFLNNHVSEKKVLYSKIKMEIAKLKKCYNRTEIEKYYDDDEKLTGMLFLDGCAVLQAIYLLPDPQAKDKEGAPNELNIKIDLLAFVHLDLLLLENQLPYRVLELLISSSNKGQRFKESIKRFIDVNAMTPAEVMKEQQRQQQEPKQGKQQKQQEEPKPAHLLDFLRTRLLAKTEEKESSVLSKGCNWLFQHIESCYQKGKTSHHSHTFRNVKELREAGIWLRPSETSCLKDISFNRVCCVGKLMLPPITVDDSTGPKFMNLIAYEMCPDFDNDFVVTSYICFLDSLIDEAEDVKALRDAGILFNGLGSDEEVAKLFNKMNTDLVPNPERYSKVTAQIQNHCSNIWITYAAQAYHTHFRSPWTFLAFVGAIAALLLSALQTYYTIHPKN
ncbi:UPF0481 protein At3g47200-like [Herrania umbratica]|uniref:UPF0481 protein At3g47200-like n=1 Tax=Herrania umbratica TaxID=108875 RepID=A0A6J1A7A0_9ROSI|nr:UPF0481 protein At3g47200-like [Herrania umbratica]